MYECDSTTSDTGANVPKQCIQRVRRLLFAIELQGTAQGILFQQCRSLLRGTTERIEGELGRCEAHGRTSPTSQKYTDLGARRSCIPVSTRDGQALSKARHSLHINSLPRCQHTASHARVSCEQPGSHINAIIDLNDPCRSRVSSGWRERGIAAAARISGTR